ncbi:alkaline phosphatase family protein [Paenibacillus dakarensis]|uniref:alkaline phosphatase family protein n=1 Tax=Paenibacillus dakarensis TaxID=1527293 RepID=UPI0006D5655D|nr:alkaline phosphatase family protein [Paenibacillus dakarensis]
MPKFIFVVLDGLRFDTAISQMGYMSHLVEKSKASLYKVKSELPSLSRPLYEVLLTGTPSWQNGITGNQVVRLSRQQSLFHLARNKGLTTAAAAYFWVSELYNRAPFDYLQDREQHELNHPIQHGKFYFDDTYPDTHLFADAEYLRRTYDPDFLYIHSMNIDDSGHKYTSDSKEYRGKALIADSILAQLLPVWMKENYHILITADHGMNEDGHHGGTGNGERDVPMFVISSLFEPGVYTDEYVPQLALAPLGASLLGLEPSHDMMPFLIPGFHNKRHGMEV